LQQYLPIFAAIGKEVKMPKDKKPHDWNQEQPHDAKSGRITSERYARNNPDKVTWV
jgi:hypothetical protein